MMVSLMDTPQGEHIKHDGQSPVTESVDSMSPDLIKEMGRQFVVQYYTVMNKCPDNLHRFYKDDSCLIHGDAPVRGQRSINEKIMTLGLKDCKAVVLQLDSLKSHHNSVVIQVTGEISNDGSDMRRFMQTFVLVEQAQGNFFVLNDIFRYQDEVYGDTTTNGGDSTEESMANSQDQSSENVYEPTAYEPKIEVPDSHLQPNGDVAGKTSIDEVQFTSTVETVEESYNRDHEVNGKSIDGYEDSPSTIPEPMPEVIIIDNQQHNQPTPVEQAPQPMVIETVTTKKAVPDGPLTWASLVGSGRDGTNTAPPQQSRGNFQQSANRVNNNHSSKPQQQATVQNQESRPARNRNASPSDVRVDSGGSRNRNFPDNHQVFVGNLPADITEHVLCEFFTKFGRVQEVRINKSKTGLPNFGFVVFDCAQSVKDVVACKPLMLDNNHRLNVEEKKGGGGGGRSGYSRGGYNSDRAGRPSMGVEGRGGSAKRH